MSATTALLLMLPWLALWALTIAIALFVEHRRAALGAMSLQGSAARTQTPHSRLPLGSVTAPYPADSCHTGSDHTNT